MPRVERGVVLMEFETTGPVLHLEHCRASATQAAVDAIGHAAMTEEATAKLIEQLADEMERET